MGKDKRESKTYQIKKQRKISANLLMKYFHQMDILGSFSLFIASLVGKKKCA